MNVFLAAQGDIEESMSTTIHLLGAQIVSDMRDADIVMIDFLTHGAFINAISNPERRYLAVIFNAPDTSDVPNVIADLTYHDPLTVTQMAEVMRLPYTMLNVSTNDIDYILSREIRLAIRHCDAVSYLLVGNVADAPLDHRAANIIRLYSSRPADYVLLDNKGQIAIVLGETGLSGAKAVANRLVSALAGVIDTKVAVGIVGLLPNRKDTPAELITQVHSLAMASVTIAKRLVGNRVVVSALNQEEELHIN